MNFNNVVNPPLVTGDDDHNILGDIFLFPELHVFTGIVGKLVKEKERNVFSTPEEGKQFMEDWMSQPGVNVSKTVYYGNASFVGNMAEKLLEKVDTLREKINNELKEEQILLAEPYRDAFEKFYLVVKACFGQTLSSNYTELIANFMTTYRSLGISIPLKVIFA